MAARMSSTSSILTISAVTTNASTPTDTPTITVTSWAQRARHRVLDDPEAA